MAPGLTDRDRHRYCHRNIWVSGSIRPDREVRAIRGIVGAEPSPAFGGWRTESAAESIFVTQMNSRICGRGENRGSRKAFRLKQTRLEGERLSFFLVNRRHCARLRPNYGIHSNIRVSLLFREIGISHIQSKINS